MEKIEIYPIERYESTNNFSFKRIKIPKFI